MAQIQILRCKNCTSPMPAGVTKCPRCGTEHQFVPEIINPLRCTPAQAFDCKEIFEGMVKANPNDLNSLFGMGLVYLGLNNYELASRNFKQAVDQTPGDPDVYYYYALSLFSKRSASLLTDAEADRIEMWLQTATKIQPKRKYLILQMILRQGAFMGKGKALAADKEEPEQLLQRAISTVQEEDELFEIEQHVNINDSQTKSLIKQLRNGGAAARETKKQSLGDGGGFKDYSRICNFPKGDKDRTVTDDGVARLNDVEERKRFFKGLILPEKPKYESKPSYFGVLFNSFLSFFFVLVVFTIIDSFQSCTHFTESKRTVSHAETVKNVEYWGHQYDSLSKKRHVDSYEKERAAMNYDNAVRNLEQLRKNDSSYIASHDVKSYDITKKEKDAKAQNFDGVPDADVIAQAEAEGSEVVARAPRGLVMVLIGTALLFGPWVLWFLVVWDMFADTIKNRKRIGEDNAKKKKDFEESTDAFHKRPTVAEFIKFCQLYVGPNVGLVTQGDVVAEALLDVRIPEGDVIKGKVYLFNSFAENEVKQEPPVKQQPIPLHRFNPVATNQSEIRDPMDPSDVLRTMVFEIAVAMPDQLYVMKAEWDTTTPSIHEFKRITRKYDSIGGTENYDGNIHIISKDGNELATVRTSRNGVGSLFRYQSVDSSNVLTYHRTRTTDSIDFVQSLNNMYFK